MPENTSDISLSTNTVLHQETLPKKAQPFDVKAEASAIDDHVEISFSKRIDVFDLVSKISTKNNGMLFALLAYFSLQAGLGYPVPEPDKVLGLVLLLYVLRN
jgi:hypothetical protein